MKVFELIQALQDVDMPDAEVVTDIMTFYGRCGTDGGLPD